MLKKLMKKGSLKGLRIDSMTLEDVDDCIKKRFSLDPKID